MRSQGSQTGQGAHLIRRVHIDLCRVASAQCLRRPS
ncbi:putative leader peptide [Streptosporangium sp. 'caverna']